jgi:hypothetical protein
MENSGVFKPLLSVRREQAPGSSVRGFCARRRKDAILVDRQPPISYAKGSELLKRLQAAVCELSGSTIRVEVHHLRKLADLNRHRRKEVPAWFRLMAARKRKTLITYRVCHEAILADGRRNRHSRHESLESRVRRKLASAVCAVRRVVTSPGSTVKHLKKCVGLPAYPRSKDQRDSSMLG